MKRVFIAWMAVGLTVATVMAQRHAPAGKPDGETVLKHLEQNYIGINDYTVSMRVSVNLERLKIPPTTVKMYFKQPDKVHYDATGFVMLPKQIAAMNFSRLHETYSIEPAVQQDTLHERRVFILTMIPKADRTRLKRVQLIVDQERWTPERIRIPLLDGRMLTANLSYQEVGNRWLPREITATFQMAQGDTSVPNIFEQITPTRRPQPPRDGSVSIGYSDYRINTGLSDDIFINENGEGEGRR